MLAVIIQLSIHCSFFFLPSQVYFITDLLWCLELIVSKDIYILPASCAIVSVHMVCDPDKNENFHSFPLVTFQPEWFLDGGSLCDDVVRSRIGWKQARYLPLLVTTWAYLISNRLWNCTFSWGLCTCRSAVKVCSKMYRGIMLLWRNKITFSHWDSSNTRRAEEFKHCDGKAAFWEFCCFCVVPV